MKKFFTTIACLYMFIGIYAQQVFDCYRRNSLCTFFITDRGRTDIDRDAMRYVAFACKTYKVPKKYDSHDLGLNRIVQIDKMRNVNGEPDYKSYVDPATGQIRKYLNRGADEDILLQFLEDNKIANRLLAKWFNASDVMVDGSYYNMELIQERGMYSASELDKLRADESVRGRAILADAGMELLSHTYVSFTYFTFITSQETNAFMGALGGAILGNSSYIGSKWQETADDRIREISGYGVSAMTGLFRLKWDKETENLFMKDYYNAPISKLLNSNDFHMEFVGWKECSPISYEKRTGQGEKGNSLLAEEATIRAIDKSLNVLQRKFEDFKVKAPLLDVEDDKITAFIGTKEGVTEKSKFEVLERVYDADNNDYKYKKIATLSIDSSHPVFDNSYVYGQEEEPVGKTYFKGKNSKLAPGMLIRQIR